MTHSIEKKCPQCGQRLRFPKGKGGILMACPSCGKKFHSDFKLGGVQKGSPPKPQGLLISIFEMPWKIASRIGRFFLSR